jgi:hypothetical protein
MSSGLKGSPLTAFPGGDKAFLAENTKELLGICLKSVHDLSRHHFYRISGEPPGTLAYLLSIYHRSRSNQDLWVLQLEERRPAFQRTTFETWVRANFERGAVEIATFKKETLIKIGHGEHPKWPSVQEKEKLDPPRF